MTSGSGRRPAWGSVIPIVAAIVVIVASCGSAGSNSAPRPASPTGTTATGGGTGKHRASDRGADRPATRHPLVGHPVGGHQPGRIESLAHATPFFSSAVLSPAVNAWSVANPREFTEVDAGANADDR